MLWGLLAAAIPIIIHLLNRRRHRTVAWAAMQFLLKATRESRGKKKLRHFFILACRTLALACLAFAVARPILSEMLGWGQSRPDLVLVLLDRSASMETIPKGGTETRRTVALRKAVETLRNLEGSRIVLIDSASNNPQEVPNPESLTELSSTAATDSAADIPSLASRAAEFLAESSGRSEVWLISDLQASSWQPANDRWNVARAALSSLPQPPVIRVLATGTTPAANSAVRILQSQRLGTQLALDLEIVRTDDASQPLNLPLTISLNGVSSTRSLTLTGNTLRLRESLPIPASEPSGSGWISLPGDGNLRDNVAFFAYGPARPIQSLVVSNPGEAADYLALSAAPPGFGGQSAQTIPPGDFSSANLSNIAAIFWHAPLPADANAEKLTRFLEDGGHALFFPPTEDSTTTFLSFHWSPLTRSEEGKLFILDSWNHDDGLLRDSLDGSAIPAERIRALQRRIPTSDAMTPLARWDDGQTFLTRHIQQRGTAWFIATIPDYRWSNLGDADALLPMAQRAVLAGAERFHSGYLTTLGSPESQLRPGETISRIDSYENLSGAETSTIAGVLRLGERTLAVNRPPAEDDPEIVPRDTLNQLLAGTRFRLFDDAGTSTADPSSQPIWQAFLIAMLAFLLGEAILCLPSRSASSPTSPSSRPLSPAA